MLVADYLVRFLESLEIDHLFGIPGYANGPLFAMLKASSIRTVLCKHEEGAAFMAYGYGLSQRGIAACAATSGAACIHLLTGVAAAYANSIPLLAITSQVERNKIGRGAFQEMSGRGPRSADVNAMFRACTIFSAEAQTPQEIPWIFAQAADALSRPRTGPVHIGVPLDILRASLELPDWRVCRSPHPGVPPLSNSVWERFLSLLQSSEAPLFLLGRGCASAQPLVREWMRKVRFPVVTTIQGRGLALHDTPWNLGVVGVAGSPRANAWMREHADLVVAIGTSLNEFTTSSFTALAREGVRVVRFDADPTAFGTTPNAELALVADARDVFRRLLASELREVPGLQGELFSLRNRHPAFLDQARDQERPGRVAPMDLMEALRAVCPPNTQFVADSGNNALWAISRLPLHGEQGFHIDINTGCMGSGVVSAIGLKAAMPELPVVAICGDGGAFMLGNEISTAADHGIDVVWVVLNDARLGMVRQGMREKFGVEHAAEFHRSDLSVWARALGACVEVIECTAEIEPAMQRALLRGRGPTVLDVRINDLYLPKSFGRFQRLPEEEAIFEAATRAVLRRCQEESCSAEASPSPLPASS